MYEIKGVRDYKECGRLIAVDCILNDIPSEDDYVGYKERDLLSEFIRDIKIRDGLILFNNEVIATIDNGKVVYLG